MSVAAGLRIGAPELARVLGLPAPTPEQAVVIESPLAPAAVVAGAGSGKTETMAARVVWLVANRLAAPDQVLGLTFTRKAAAELGLRVRRRLAQWRRHVEATSPDDVAHLALLQSGEPTVVTYAAYAGRLVAEHALRAGAEPDSSLLSPARLWQLSDAMVRRWGGELPEFGAISSLVHWVMAAADQLADHLVTPEQVVAFCTRSLEEFFALPLGERARSETPNNTEPYVTALRQRAAIMPLIAAFRADKLALGAVDFGDQMRLAAQLAELPEVAAVERERYRAVLLDEYQDTGHAQVVMLRGLFGAGHPLTAVGDPFQSIYGWRGASSGTMGAFAATFPQGAGRPAPVHPLATSFRNDRAILAAANAVAAALRRDTINPELVAAPAAGPGEVRVAVTETVAGEADWVAARIRAAWDQRPEGERTAAVLVRRRSQLPLLADALLRAGLPIEIVGLGGLLTTPEVVDVVATLRVLADHRSGGAVMRLLTGARWRIGARDLAELRSRAAYLVRPEDDAEPEWRETPSLIEALDDLGPPARYSRVGFGRLQRLSGELRRLRRRLSAPLAELVAEVERVIGVDVEVAARPDRAHVGRVHLDRFLDVAADFAAEAGDSSLRAFLAYLEAAEDEENGLEAGEVVVAAERVQLLTVHGAKGLEWDVVAVAGLVEGVFPGAASGSNWARARQELPVELRGDRDSLPPLGLTGVSSRKEVGDRLKAHDEAVRERHREEERRLAYVALTRARSVLVLSGYAWDATKTARRPAPFLAEVAELGRAGSPGVSVEEWFAPEPDAVNPTIGEPVVSAWPLDPLGPSPSAPEGRRADVRAGAELVRAAGDVLPGFAELAAPIGGPAEGSAAGSAEEPATEPRVAAWRRDVDDLLAERARQRLGDIVEVALPVALSVSALVELQRDPGALARRLHRPMPAPPAPWARRGTAFHQWLEQRWGRPALLDIDELPGSADESASGSAAERAELAGLQEAFEASTWAGRVPAQIEVGFEMSFDGAAVVRGRMDAVFGDAAQGWEIVDWKTGRRPTGADAAAAAVQLAAYRLAWARLTGIPDDQLDRISAAFHYVRDDVTVRPADLLDAEGLRRLVRG